MPLSSKSVDLDFKIIGYRIRQRRKELKLSTADLACRAKIARHTLVRIESGLPCHYNTLQRVRHALQLFTDQMTRPIAEPTNCAIQRKADLKWTISKVKGTYQKQIVDDDPYHVNDESDRKRLGNLGLQPFFTAIFESELKGGASTQGLMELHQPSWVDRHPGEEFVYCLRGSVTMTVEGVAHKLGEGDAISFDGNLPHQYSPSEPIGPKDPAALILMVVAKVAKKAKRSSAE